MLEERRSAGATILIASHEGDDVGMADRILWFETGKIIEDSAPADIISRRIGCFVGVVDEDASEASLEAELAPLARSWSRDGGRLTVVGDDTLRAPFVAAMERHGVPGYVVRPARSSDLLELIRADAGGRP